MILKYNLYIASATALVGRTNAFAPSSSSLVSSRISQSTSTSLCSLNSEWDNKDFLSSLSGSSDDIQKANEDYNRLASSREAKNEWLVRSMAPPGRQAGSSTELGATSGGGPSPDFLAKMGYGQQQQQPSGSFQPPAQPVQQQPPQQQAPPQFYDQFGNPITTMPMVYDANGNLVPFNPQPQQAPPQQTQPPPQATPPQSINVIEPPLPPKTKGESADHHPVGYNPDAYTMSNTADVYFAQLKQDSKVRKQAWLSGDVERANQVFADESVKKIGESWVENPYTKEQNFLEARAQIEGAVRMQVLRGEEARASSGISYRRKLEEMKAKRGGGGAVNSGEKKVEPAKPVANAAPPAALANPGPPAPVAPAVPKPNVAPANPVRPPPPPGLIPVDMTKPGAIPPPPKMMSGPSTPVATKSAYAVSTPVSTVPTAPAAGVSQTATTTANDEEDTRRKLRTLQGLLLKQRGGPGFGAGRLRAPEAQRLESTLEEVRSILRAEVSSSATPARSVSPAKLVAPPEPVMNANPVPKAPAPVAPPPQPTPATSTASPDPMAGSVACVEAALKMYKEASPSEREALLIPLREAFMAAAGASNKVIAETELNAHKAAMGSASSAQSLASQPVAERSTPMMGFPTSYNVAMADPPSMDTTAAFKGVEIGNAESTQTLEDAYNALVDVSGGGKFGLKNISGNEASQLAAKLTAMRGVLLDELN